jgi:hypothetical protein
MNTLSDCPRRQADGHAFPLSAAITATSPKETTSCQKALAPKVVHQTVVVPDRRQRLNRLNTKMVIAVAGRAYDLARCGGTGGGGLPPGHDGRLMAGWCRPRSRQRSPASAIRSAGRDP